MRYIFHHYEPKKPGDTEALNREARTQDVMLRLPPFAFVSWMGFATALLTVSAGAAAVELPPLRQGSNLPDCLAKLEPQGGGWCEIRQSEAHPSISSVWPRDIDRKTHMNGGPEAVLKAWNGAAFDAENLLLYFMGGGHADYGGNEVYEFDLKSGKWDRLTEPSPLDFLFVFRRGANDSPTRYCWAPDMRRVPGAAHTYDGLQFSSKTKTVFMMMMGAATGSCFDDRQGEYRDDPRVIYGGSRGHGVFEFNPSRQETHNGLKPLTWRRVTDPKDVQLSYPRSVELPDGTMLLGNRHTLRHFDPVTGTVGGTFWKAADSGDGLAVFHPASYVLSLHDNKLKLKSLDTGFDHEIPARQPHGKSMAVDKNGVVFSWNGGRHIATIDPFAEEKAWQSYNWGEAGPSDGNYRVYSKWHYIPSQDVFVGLSIHTSGVWIYMHPSQLTPAHFRK